MRLKTEDQDEEEDETYTPEEISQPRHQNRTTRGTRRDPSYTSTKSTRLSRPFNTDIPSASTRPVRSTRSKASTTTTTSPAGASTPPTSISPSPSPPPKRRKSATGRTTSSSSSSVLKRRRNKYDHHSSKYDLPTEYATLKPHGLGEVTTEIDNFWIYLFFRFCGERQRMQEKRDNGVPRDQLSEDETMKKMFVGNVFRELDNGSVKMKKQIMAEGDQSIKEICFRVFLYCGFYEGGTWDALVQGLGEIPSWRKFDLKTYESILYQRSFVERKTIYTSGFQIVPPTKYFGLNLPHFAATLRFIKCLMEIDLPSRLRTCTTAVDASYLIQTVPTLGPFLSLNLLCYLNDSKDFKFHYRNYASCGPGSRLFLQRMFGKEAINSTAMEEAGLKWLYDNQWRYWARLGEDPPYAHRVSGIRPGMRVLDFENALCWCHRYVNDYQQKGYTSLADLPPPMYGLEADEADMPAWCEEERYLGNVSRTAFQGDYEEEKQKLDAVDDQEEFWEVEKIVCRVGDRKHKNGLFRVRWKGYPPEEDTWERAESLKDGAQEVLQEWLDWESKVWSTIERVKNDYPYTWPNCTKPGETEDSTPNRGANIPPPPDTEIEDLKSKAIKLEN